MSDLVYPLPLSHCFLSLFLFIISIGAQSIDSRYPNCHTYNCSDVTIKYPFWRIDSEPSTLTCGYQGFGINCSDDGERNISTIILGRDSYYVKSINYHHRSIVLIDYDFSPAVVDVPNCPRVQHNITLETLPLNFHVHSVHLSFHFNCNEEMIPSFATRLRCVGDLSYFNIINPESESFDWDRLSCDKEVVTTVFYDENIKFLHTLKTALSKGFELTWGKIDDCHKCEESDGRCGFHNTTEFMCFYPKDAVSREAFDEFIKIEMTTFQKLLLQDFMMEYNRVDSDGQIAILYFLLASVPVVVLTCYALVQVFLPHISFFLSSFL